MANTTVLVRRGLVVGALVGMVARGGAATTVTATTTTTTQAGASAVAALFAGVATSQSLTRTTKTLDSTQETCNNLGRGPDRVLMMRNGATGEFGSSSDPFTLVATDFCTDANNAAQSGAASDGYPLFAYFLLHDTVTATCDGTAVELRAGSGVTRNVDGTSQTTEIYGRFDVDGTIMNCTFQLVDGAIDTANSSCNDRNGSISLSASSICTMTTDIARIAVPATIEGHYAVTMDEGQDVTYDCHNFRNQTEDANSGIYSISTDCTTFTAYGFNLQSYSIGYVVTGDENGWTFYRTSSDEDVFNRIKIMRQAGYPVLAAIDMLYVANYDPNDPSSVQDGAEFPAALLASADFQQELGTEIVAVAAVIEDLNVEIFSPLSEPDRVFGSASAAATFLQNLRASIEAAYTGGLMWIGYEYTSSDPTTYNLTGFDYAVVNISPLPSITTLADFETQVSGTLSNLSAIATSYGVPFLISNAGVWGEAIGNSHDWGTDEHAREAFQTMYNQSVDAGAAGIIFWEGATGEVTLDGYPLVSDYVIDMFN